MWQPSLQPCKRDSKYMHVAQNPFYNFEILIFFFLNIFANVFFFSLF